MSSQAPLCSTGFQALGAPADTYIFGAVTEGYTTIVDVGIDAPTAEAFGCTDATENYEWIQVLHHVPGKSSRSDWPELEALIPSLFGEGTDPNCLQPAPPAVCGLYAKTIYTNECPQEALEWTDRDPLTTGIFDYDVDTGLSSGRFNPAGVYLACVDYVESYEQFCFCPGESYEASIDRCASHLDRVAADMGCSLCTNGRRKLLMGDMPCCPF